MRATNGLISFAFICSGATAASAQTQPAGAQPAAFGALLACRSITDSAARLQCYDNAANGLQAAAQRRDIVVVDRQQVQQTRRRLFGFALPSVNLFGRDDGPPEEQVTSIESTVAGATQDGNGNWVVTLAEGGTWAQSDGTPLALRPRAGQRVVINRGALGSYMMRINNQPGIRARRVG